MVLLPELVHSIPKYVFSSYTLVACFIFFGFLHLQLRQRITEIDILWGINLDQLNALVHDLVRLSTVHVNC